MKIKRSRKRSLMRFLVRVGMTVTIALIGLSLFSFRRIDNNLNEPDYRDGDLVFVSKWGEETTFLLLRVRGFEK